jgi:hypothetical protein
VKRSAGFLGGSNFVVNNRGPKVSLAFRHIGSSVRGKACFFADRVNS